MASSNVADRRAAALALVPEGMFLADRFVQASTGRTFAVTDPATGDVLAEVPDASVADAVAAADFAVGASAEMAALSPRDRSDLLLGAYHAITERSDEFASLISLEMGKSHDEALGEVRYGADFFRWFAGEPERLHGDFRVAPDGSNRLAVLAQPVGPCVLITPWNFPLAMITRKLAPAWAAGCTAVVKPAEQTPLTTLAVAKLLTDLGAPCGALSVLTTTDPASVVTALIEHPGTRKVSFTGSTPIGRLLARQAGEQLMRTSFELGGNAPFLVFADADLDRAVEGAIVAKMRNMGEACTAANRVLVESSVAEEFADRFVQRIAAMTLGHGLDPATDVGPMIDQAAIDKVASLVDDAVGRGARVMHGGGSVDGPGTFFEPTVLVDVADDSEIGRVEIFGPVTAISTFDTEDQAIATANATPFGLVAYVFTSDLDRGIRVSERLEAGMIGLNRGLVSNVAAPFGGVKDSGLGREGGREGIEEYLALKYIAIDTPAR